MKTVNDFKDYQIIDMADGMKLETWNNLKLLRPDPQIIWNEKRDEKLWYDVDAVYKRSNTGGGCWDIKNNKILIIMFQFLLVSLVDRRTQIQSKLSLILFSYQYYVLNSHFLMLTKPF